jgi:hypothetical protein
MQPKVVSFFAPVPSAGDWAMFSRPLLLTIGLAAATLVPYVLLDDKLAAGAKEKLASFMGSGKSEATAGAEPAASGEKALGVAGAAAQSATVPLEEAIRFDVTPQWVTERFTRVSTVAGEANELGLRVILVSGTELSDVAGSLTYYFDSQQHVQRITLAGVTGDDSRLAGLATQKFGMRATETSDRGLYYGGDLNVPTSSLRVKTLPVVTAEAPYARVQVDLDIRRGDVAKVKPEAERPAKVLPSAYRRW